MARKAQIEEQRAAPIVPAVKVHSNGHKWEFAPLDKGSFTPM